MTRSPPIDESIPRVQLKGRQLSPSASLSYCAVANLLASATYDGAVNLWQLNERQCLSLPTSWSRADAVAIDHHGSFVAAIGYSPAEHGVVNIWNATTGKLLGSHRSDATEVGFLDDGALFTANESGFSVQRTRRRDYGVHDQIWLLFSGPLLDRLAGFRGRCLSVSPDGGIVIVNEPSIVAKSLPDNRVLWRCDFDATCVTISRKGQHVVAGGMDGVLHWLDLHTGGLLKTQRVCRQPICAITPADKEDEYFIALDDSTICKMSTASSATIQYQLGAALPGQFAITSHPKRRSCFALRKKGLGTAATWDGFRSLSLIDPSSTGEWFDRSMRFGNKTDSLAIKTRPTQLSLFSKSGRVPIEINVDQPIVDFAWRSDDREIVALLEVERSHWIRKVDCLVYGTRGNVKSHWTPPQTWGVWRLTQSGEFLAMASSRGVRIHRIDGTPIFESSDPFGELCADEIMYCDFDLQSRHLTLCDRFERIAVLNAMTGEPVWRGRQRYDGVISAATAGKGRWLITGPAHLNGVECHDLRSQNGVMVWDEHANACKSVCSIASGDRFASCARDGTVMFWNAKRGKVTGTLWTAADSDSLEWLLQSSEGYFHRSTNLDAFDTARYQRREVSFESLDSTWCDYELTRRAVLGR